MLTSQRWLDVVANNLANANTTGFKRDVVAFNDAFVRELARDGGLGNAIGSMGSGMTMRGEATIYDKGSVYRTNNPLDLAIETERGMFAVEGPNGVRYTRDGAFHLNSNGEIVTAAGDRLLDEQGRPIAIRDEGAISVTRRGDVTAGGRAVATVGVYDGTFRKLGSNLYASTDATAMARDEVDLAPNSLEGSNVNAIHSMTEMIALQRGFEMAQRSVISEDEAAQRLIQSLQR
ncbi:MAG: flagellar hook-basal body protein [Fimbriimonadaceae bacterium]|nr:flagellar hook-basal body protein [Fimbriimonadaceae bacterium]